MNKGRGVEQDILSLKEPVQAVLKGLGFVLIELSVSRHRGSVQIRVVIYNCGCRGKAASSPIGTDDCSKVHRALMPRFELAFEQQDIYLEVSSPGVDRLIKDNSEFAHYLGRGVRCYRTDITEWTAGILESADEEGITIKKNGEVFKVPFGIIAKAKLDSSQEV